MRNSKAEGLGLYRSITRRDFINGVAAGAAATILPAGGTLAQPIYAPEKSVDYYPPGITGLRNDASIFGSAHGAAWAGQSWNNPEMLTEEYDLVVVGAGASGLAAAWHYQQLNGADSRILILDNHDDFGGHARRNEFQADGRTILHPGGSVRLATERVNPEMAEFLERLGIDVAANRQNQAADARNRSLDLRSGIYFSERDFGTDKTIIGDFLPLNRLDSEGNYELIKHIDEMPLAQEDKASLMSFLSTRQDVLPGLDGEGKVNRLNEISYSVFMLELAGLSAAASQVLFTYTKAISSYDADDMPAWYGMRYGLPGLNHLGDFGAGEMAKQEVHGDPNIYFPDGNGSVSRLFVKKLIPDVSRGEDSVEAIIDQRFDYSRLDLEGSSVRLRLNSTVVKAVNQDTGVALDYVRGGLPYRISARHCVLACYNMMIPYLCPEMSGEQKEALSYNVKLPYLATNVLLRSGKPILEAGAASYYCPGQLHGEILSCGRDFGTHKQPLSAESPATLYLIDSMLDGDKSEDIKERYRKGRQKMLSMTFEEMELDIRQQLAGILADTSFDAREDILGITVNRWGHGYSYGYNPLFDPHFAEGRAPHEIGRKRFGNITIANSDAGAVAALEVAMEQGIRAAEELGQGPA